MNFYNKLLCMDENLFDHEKSEDYEFLQSIILEFWRILRNCCDMNRIFKV